MGAQRWLVNPRQGRRDPVDFLGEVHPSGYLEEKQESVWRGRRSEGWKGMCKHLAEKVISPAKVGTCQRCRGER